MIHLLHLLPCLGTLASGNEVTMLCLFIPTFLSNTVVRLVCLIFILLHYSLLCLGILVSQKQVTNALITHPEISMKKLLWLLFLSCTYTVLISLLCLEILVGWNRDTLFINEASIIKYHSSCLSHLRFTSLLISVGNTFEVKKCSNCFIYSCSSSIEQNCAFTCFISILLLYSLLYLWIL